ncbi:MAG TPA: TIM-barrel domain-containing protein [Thermoanaerobaculia bacterium]|nr:TIM-barrel domain-containing protein [Thermoanaerobaculia bacterium]
MIDYTYVNVEGFTPNSGSWTTLADVVSVAQSGNAFTLTMSSGPAPLIVFLTPSIFRVRFNPAADYSSDFSVAVVQSDFGPVNVQLQDAETKFVLDTGVIRVEITKSPYALAVYRGQQLLHSDTPTYNIVYIPGQVVTANFKLAPASALYYGFGEKAGSTLAKNDFDMTFFNWDNFTYTQGGIPSGEQPGPLNPAEPLYCSVPFLIETNPHPVAGPRYSYGIFFDNPAQTFFNITANDYSDMSGKYYLGALYGDLNYYFIHGAEVPDVIDGYTSLTGRPAMPPKYALGYHQGCYGYYDANKVMGAAQAYRNAQIPCDGLHIDVDFQDNYRTFTSSNIKFPNPTQFFDALHGMGFKCSTNITPLVTTNPLDENGNQTVYPALASGMALGGTPAGAFIYGTLADQGESPNLFIGSVNYGQNTGLNPLTPPGTALGSFGAYADFGRDDVRTWWGQQYEYLCSIGLDMVWQDMMCPALAQSANSTFPLALMMTYGGQFQPNATLHNAYGLMLLRATYEGLQQIRPTQRPFIIARGGYAGSQRYAANWTGDSASSWNFLLVNAVEVMNMGMAGVPLAGCDIGGFANGSPSDPSSGTVGGSQFDPQTGTIVGGVTSYELLTRWMQLGSFLPWYRNHYDGYTKGFQEPYMYGEPVPTNCRFFVQLRYRMMDTYYSAMWQSSQTGLPITRALFLNDPDDPNAYVYCNDEFFVGRDFLVAPILARHDTASPPTQPVRSVYLPAGSEWYAFKDNEYPLDAPVAGGTTIQNWYAPLTGEPLFQVPMYVRAGAVLPMRDPGQQFIDPSVAVPITFNIYPGPDSSFDLYLDDGITAAPAPYRLVRVSHAGQQVRIQRIEDNYTPPESFYYVSFLGVGAPSSVTAAGQTLPNAGSADGLSASNVNAWYYNATIQQTFIKIFDNQPDITLEAQF